MDDLHVELGDDHVGLIEIRRPPNNFFDQALIAGIADGLERLADDGARAVVLASEGKHFCAGANFGQDRSVADTTEGSGRHLYDEALRLFAQPLPIVAAVQGAAIGGGLGLALAADLRVACPEARFAANFARLGFHHGFGLTVTLPLVAGHQAALDLLYTGRRVDGDTALALGLCDRLVAAADVRSAATEMAADIAASGPLAVRSIRATMRGPLVDQLRAATARERAEQERLQRTADFGEGVRAVAERRPAQFRGQ